MSSDRLTPFSYVILVLVGRGGAGPHDLRRNSEQGRIYWEAAPSQWYAEPKRLAQLGLLSATKQPGRTRERTHYELTEAGRAALAEWVRTPARLPRIQNELVVRLLAGDLVDPDAVAQGLAAVRAEIEETRAHLDRAAAGYGRFPHREALLRVSDSFARDLLDAIEVWADRAEAVLRARG